MSRWYDKRPCLGKRLDAFKGIDQRIREPILNVIIELVKNKQPNLLTFEKASEFRFDSTQLRWYEHDPHLWLVFSILQLANVDILDSVENYLESSANESSGNHFQRTHTFIDTNIVDTLPH